MLAVGLGLVYAQAPKTPELPKWPESSHLFIRVPCWWWRHVISEHSTASRKKQASQQAIRHTHRTLLLFIGYYHKHSPLQLPTNWSRTCCLVSVSQPKLRRCPTPTCSSTSSSGTRVSGSKQTYAPLITTSSWQPPLFSLLFSFLSYCDATLCVSGDLC